MQLSAHEPRLLYLDPRELEADEENVRRDAGDLDGLASSMRRYGVLQPLGVVPLPASERAGARPRYRVLYGNRRREAAVLAGLPVVPCLPVSIAGGAERLVAQLLENMQRCDLNDMEKAEGLSRLGRELAAEAPTGETAEALHGRVAALVGLSLRTVRRYLALRDLPAAVRDLVAEERLSVTQAQHLIQLPTAQLQESVAQRAAAGDWTAAAVSRVCTALAQRPDLSLDEAGRLAEAGARASEPLTKRRSPPQPATGHRGTRSPSQAAVAEDEDDELWSEDATGAPTPEASGEPDLFGAPARPTTHGGSHQPETADGHRVFRIRSVGAFCDEADRLVRCAQDGDLQRAIRGDTTAPARLRLAAKQLAFTLRALESLLDGIP